MVGAGIGDPGQIPKVGWTLVPYPYRDVPPVLFAKVMHALPNPPLLANHAASDGVVSPGKNGQAIPKLRRAAPMISPLDFPGDELKANDENGTNGAESVRIWKARNYIHEHSGEELSLGQVARAANTSTNYFSEKFKEATGVNFVRYVAQARFEKAAQLLGQADLRVSEIAFAAGFQSLSQFNRVFKKFAGKSPTEYRAATPAGNGSGNGAAAENHSRFIRENA